MNWIGQLFVCQFLFVLVRSYHYNFYAGNDLFTYYPGKKIPLTRNYWTTSPKLFEVLDEFPGVHMSTNKFSHTQKLNETFEKYVKTYFEPNENQFEALKFKFNSLESNMESLENKSIAVNKQLQALKISDDMSNFWVLQYQRKSLQKLIKKLNSSNLPAYSKILAKGIKLPLNTSTWIKSFDEIFEELRDGEPLVDPELFKQQKHWWHHNRKPICIFKIEQLRNYIKLVDNFFYQNKEVLSVHKWIKDREKLYARKLSDLFWWLCRRDQYYREEYARVDYDKVWTPWKATTIPPHLTTFDYFRFNGDMNHLLKRRNKFYAKFFKRKKIGHFIKKLKPISVSTTNIYEYLLSERLRLNVVEPKKELVLVTKKKRNIMKLFCFQYFGNVKNVGFRTAIHKEIKTNYKDSIRGYVMYTHKRTVFGKICGPVQDVDEMKEFIKKLKTPKSKVTKLEIRGESIIHRYPKGLQGFHFFHSIFEDSRANTESYCLEDLIKKYKFVCKDKTKNDWWAQPTSIEEQLADSNIESKQVDRDVNLLFKQFGAAQGGDVFGNKIAMQKYNLKLDGVYDDNT